MAKFYPSGLLGFGLTGLMASFMSGMAGNVTAFNTVFTYDIYQSYIRKSAPDSHYLFVGRMTTIFGTVASLGAAYLATRYNNMMDLLQLVFGFVNAPLFATMMLGMFWKRSTGHGAFSGLASGTVAATLTLCLTEAEGKGGWIAPLYHARSAMAQSFMVASAAFAVTLVVTVLVSLMTQPKPEPALDRLVYGLTEIPKEGHLPWFRRPWPVAIAVAVLCLALNFLFR